MAETIIGPSIQIEGDIVGSDALTVLGTVRGGRIQVKEGVVVVASGRIEGDVESAAVEIAGVVQGNVAATDKVELKSGGKLLGDVKAPRILIADGASFKGNINMGG
jgi:cytoskeletal protein CcmA (bactofilin family)